MTRKSAQAVATPTTFLDPATLPEIYGLQCVGDCMAPEVPDGSKVAGSKSMPYQKGDLVLVWLRPEAVRSGGYPAIVKRLMMPPAPWVKGFPYREHPQSEVRAIVGLGMNSMPGQMMVVRCADVLAIHRAVAVMVPGQDGYRSILRDNEALPEPERTSRRRRAVAVAS